LSWDNDRDKERKRADARYKKALTSGELDVFGLRFMEETPEPVPPLSKTKKKTLVEIVTKSKSAVRKVDGKLVEGEMVELVEADFKARMEMAMLMPDPQKFLRDWEMEAEKEEPKKPMGIEEARKVIQETINMKPEKEKPKPDIKTMRRNRAVDLEKKK